VFVCRAGRQLLTSVHEATVRVSIPFDNSYARLPERFYKRLAPTPVSTPGLIKVNHALAAELGIDPSALESDEGVAVLAGNKVPEGADPLAQAYAGHQFGGWVPQLGDGRAILLGEVVDQAGERRDIQLKGSGRTPFSRGGDGRAWLGPVMREYLISEAMHALGVPTTRSLAAVTTGDAVRREWAYPGAVLTRVARSHIRVGTFQFFAFRKDQDALQALFEHVVERHYPVVDTPLDLLRQVLARQATLVAKWMGVGFIHGVMNTDNVQIAGETIDYGPCAFMDTYDPLTVYSSIDRNGRYAYGRQPDLMIWDLAQLATALLPIIDDDEDKAVQAATEVMGTASASMKQAWLEVFRRKLGLTYIEDNARLAEADTELVHQLLAVMAEGEADFTNTFRALPDIDAAKAHFGKTDVAEDGFERWASAWARRLRAQGEDLDAVTDRLREVNPALIPRNHRVEEAIQAGLKEDFSVFERLLDAWSRPFETRDDLEELTRPPQAHEVVQQTFCGT
jgi:uncharacterized protein YdiU (UPF0061 family)